jgi:hypothetical protein
MVVTLLFEMFVSWMFALVQLQQEKDPHHWGIDTHALHVSMRTYDVKFVRAPVRFLLYF